MKILMFFLLFVNVLFAQVGQISAIKGQVEVIRKNNILPTKVGFELLENDTIKTKQNSKAQIIMQDDTAITVGQNTTFSVLNYLVSNKQNSHVNINVTKGVLRIISGKISKIAPEKFTLKTKTSTMGIRGTNFIVQTDGLNDKFICTSGKIQVMANNISVLVNAGYFTHVKQNLAPIQPKKFTPNMLKNTLNNQTTQNSSHEQIEQVNINNSANNMQNNIVIQKPSINQEVQKNQTIKKIQNTLTPNNPTPPSPAPNTPSSNTQNTPNVPSSNIPNRPNNNNQNTNSGANTSNNQSSNAGTSASNNQGSGTNTSGSTQGSNSGANNNQSGATASNNQNSGTSASSNQGSDTGTSTSNNQANGTNEGTSTSNNQGSATASNNQNSGANTSSNQGSGTNTSGSTQGSNSGANNNQNGATASNNQNSGTSASNNQGTNAGTTASSNQGSDTETSNNQGSATTSNNQNAGTNASNNQDTNSGASASNNQGSETTSNNNEASGENIPDNSNTPSSSTSHVPNNQPFIFTEVTKNLPTSAEYTYKGKLSGEVSEFEHGRTIFYEMGDQSTMSMKIDFGDVEPVKLIKWNAFFEKEGRNERTWGEAKPNFSAIDKNKKSVYGRVDVFSNFTAKFYGEDAKGVKGEIENFQSIHSSQRPISTAKPMRIKKGKFELIKQ